MLELGLKILICYLLGSVNGSLLLGRLSGGVDIRTTGSGNAGGTNALRTRGPLFALGVVIIDIAKGAIAAGPLAAAALPGVPHDPALSPHGLAASCAAAAVVGHIYPFWFDFRGGKGGATIVGAVAVFSPAALGVLLAVWVLVLVLTGYVGLATMSAATSLPIGFAWLVDSPARSSLIVFGLGMAALVIYAHRGNLARMRAGEESRQTGIMLLRRLGGHRQ